MEYLLDVMTRHEGQLERRATGQISKQEKRILRDELLGLITACPFGKYEPEDCPMFALQQMEPKQCSRWLDALTEGDLSYLASYHQVCLGMKLAPEELTPSP